MDHAQIFHNSNQPIGGWSVSAGKLPGAGNSGGDHSKSCAGIFHKGANSGGNKAG